jgi:uncharacterized protein (DUF2267 family)
MPEPNGRVSLRDVYTAVEQVEGRIVDRIDRLERAMDRRTDEHDVRLDTVCTRVTALEQRHLIADTRTQDVRSVLGDTRTTALFVIAIGAFAMSILTYAR